MKKIILKDEANKFNIKSIETIVGDFRMCDKNKFFAFMKL